MSTADSTTASAGESKSKEQLEIDYLKMQIEKLSLDIGELKSDYTFGKWIRHFGSIVTTVIALAGFWFSIMQYSASDNDRTESIRREAAAPFFQTQFTLYLRASEAAATIATTDDPKVRSEAEKDFWELYWGPLACVEDVGVISNSYERDSDIKDDKRAAVEAAMVRFGKKLKGIEEVSKCSLTSLSLELAHAIRDVAAQSFKLPTPVVERTKVP